MNNSREDATLSTIDVLLLLVLAVGLPLHDRYVDSPRFRRWLRTQPTRARPWQYAATCLITLTLTSVALVAWHVAGRPWAALGLTAVKGWRAWASFGATVALILLLARSLNRLARDQGRRLRLRERLERLLPADALEFIPRTSVDRAFAVLVALTAGVGEEMLYRGYFTAILAPWLSWWGAAALSVGCFGLAHNYQGRAGIARAAAIGAALTLVVAVTGSLLPAMVLHATMDLNLLLLSMAFLDPRKGAPCVPAEVAGQ